MNLKLKWIKPEETISYELRGTLEYELFWGTIRIAVIYNNWFRMKVDPGAYIAEVLLPGVEWFSEPFVSIEQAQAEVENEFILWTERVGLT